MRMLASCSIVDLKRVIEAVKTNQDPLPEELYKPKGRLALAFVMVTMDAGMVLDDMTDIRQVKFYDNNKFEVEICPRVDQDKRRKWKNALAVPLNLDQVKRRFEYGKSDIH